MYSIKSNYFLYFDWYYNLAYLILPNPLREYTTNEKKKINDIYFRLKKLCCMDGKPETIWICRTKSESNLFLCIRYLQN